MTAVMDKARTAIYAALDALNEQLPAEQKLKKAPETILLGKAGTLDSVSFIGLMVLVEEKCQDEWGVSVSLSDGLTDDPKPRETDHFQKSARIINNLSQQMVLGTSDHLRHA